LKASAEYLAAAGLLVSVLAGQAAAATGNAQEHAAQPQDTLQRMLKITWKKGSNLPQGFQDSAAGIIGNTLVTAGGFCSGQKNVPGKPDTYPRGFLRKGFWLDLSNPNAGWFTLPDLPGSARQGLAGLVVDGKLYAWGGLNYSAPFTYKEGYRLSRAASAWAWDHLPDLPGPIVWPGICAIGGKIYLVGGCDYDSDQFYTRAGRSGGRPGLGARLLVIDTGDLKAGWQRLSDCPGTPRFTPAVAAVGGRVYVIGGATGNHNPSRSYRTVVDNWVYDPATRRWARIRDLPVASGNFFSGQIAYKDRYILLVGGYQYPEVENPDGTVRKSYGIAHKHYENNAYFSDVWAYDTKTGLFGTADPLPLNNNTPMTVVRGNRIYLVGGETGGSVILGEHFGHHPDLLLIGEIEEIR
jgi:N-acetylneuraminic acid mutarotase